MLSIQARVGGFVLPFANARHAHEMRVLKDMPLRDEQVIVAGVIDVLTNFIEHPEVVADPETIKLLPERLRALIERSKKLNDQVRRLDANIYAPPLAPDKPQGGNPVERQLGLLKAAFEQDGH